MVVERPHNQVAKRVDQALRLLETEVDHTVRRMRKRLLRLHANTEEDGKQMPVAAKIAAWTGAALGIASGAAAGLLYLQNIELVESNRLMGERLDALCSSQPEDCLELSGELSTGLRLLRLTSTEDEAFGVGANDFRFNDTTRQWKHPNDEALAVAVRDLKLRSIPDPILGALILDTALEYGRARSAELSASAGYSWPPDEPSSVRQDDAKSIAAAIHALRTLREKLDTDENIASRRIQLEDRLAAGQPSHEAHPEHAGIGEDESTSAQPTNGQDQSEPVGTVSTEGN